MKTIGNKGINIKEELTSPIEKVWNAWINPEQIAEWWGPMGFTNTIHEMDLIPNGKWELTMHGPDGKNYRNKSIFIEIIPLKKIVFQHFNPDYLATIYFSPIENGTLLDWNMQFETEELFETVVKVFKADKGLEENIEKLVNHLNKI